MSKILDEIAWTYTPRLDEGPSHVPGEEPIGNDDFEELAADFALPDDLPPVRSRPRDLAFDDRCSLTLVRPLSDRARSWVKQHRPHGHWFKDALVVEPHDALELTHAAIADDLSIE
jgi:hypothetical protein